MEKKITVREALRLVEAMRPNAVAQDIKLKFLNEIEADIQELLNNYEIPKEEPEEPKPNEDPLELGEAKPEKKVPGFEPYTENGLEAEMLLPERFSGVYTYYVMAKIDALEDEIENYSNDGQMYQAERDALTGYLLRNYRRKHAKVRGLF